MSAVAVCYSLYNTVPYNKNWILKRNSIVFGLIQFIVLYEYVSYLFDTKILLNMLETCLVHFTRISSSEKWKYFDFPHKWTENNLKMKTNDKYNCYENWEHFSTYFQTDAMFETWLMKTRNIYPNDK
jgi:hypothetical protein